jgi:hypothetical protein
MTGDATVSRYSPPRPGGHCSGTQPAAWRFDVRALERLPSGFQRSNALRSERVTRVSSSRSEPDVPLTAMPEHVKKAKCADVTRCTFALAGRDPSSGVHPTFVAQYDDRVGEVQCVWEIPDPKMPGVVRLHSGYLRPATEAIRIMMLTDTNKRKMVRTMPPEGVNLVITDHVSRRKQNRTPEQIAAQAARARELAELRASGLAPPPVKRKANSRIPRTVSPKANNRFVHTGRGTATPG